MKSQPNLKKSLKEAKILAIDDDEWFLRLLIKKFGDVDPSFKITPVYSASEAIEALRVESFDCILCDHKLPGTIEIKGKIFPSDGIHLMRKFSEELNIDTPVIFVTGQGSEEIASQALLQGASGYFIKRVQPGYYSLMVTSIRQTIDRYWLQKELQNSEARYRDLFENSAGLIFIFDSEGRLQESNKGALDLYGYSLEESQAITYKELAYDKDVKKWKEMLDSIVKGNSEARMLRSITKDRQILHLDVTARPIFGKEVSQDVIGIQAIARDITHQIKTQQALIDSEEKHRKIVEGTIEGIVIMDNEGKILDWNPAARVITGLSQEETLGKQISDIIRQLDPIIIDSDYKEMNKDILLHEKFQEVLLSEKQSEIPSPFKYHITNLVDNSRHILESIGFTIEHSKGYRVALVLRDITEQHLAEMASKSYAKRFQTLIERTPLGVWITDIEDEKTTYVNDSVANLLGYSPHEILGRPVFDFISTESAKKLRGQTLKRLEGKDTENTYELTFYHRSGDKIYTVVTGAAIQDDDGKIYETYGFIRDITYEKEQQLELQTTKEFLESIFSSTPSGFYTYDLNCKITMANERLGRILGYSPQKLIGKSLFDLFPVFEHTRVKELVKERFMGQKSDDSLFLTYITAQGNEIKASVSSTPLFLEGEVDGAIVTVTDITEQKRIERYLSEVQKEYDGLLNNISQGFIKINNLGQIIAYNRIAQEKLEFTGLSDLRSLNVLHYHKFQQAGLSEKFRDLIYQKEDSKGITIESKIENDHGKEHSLIFHPIPIFHEDQPRVKSWILLFDKQP